MTPFRPFESTAVLLPLDDVDTDQIIPARYLKGTEKTGLGKHLFADRRERPDFAFPARPTGDQILIGGINFGCGSSREHAPWALVDWGFRAIVARSFADIFGHNATKNGLLPIALDDDAYAHVLAARRADPSLTLRVDLAAQRLSIVRAGANGGGNASTGFSFAIEPFAKHCLLSGLDELGYLLGFDDRITAYERSHS